MQLLVLITGSVLVAWVQFVGRRVVWCLVGVQKRSGSGEQVGIFRASKPPQSAPGGKTCKKQASEAFSGGMTEELMLFFFKFFGTVVSEFR